MLNFVKIGTHKFLNYYIIMVSYKELGLVNTREMFAKAIKWVCHSRFQFQ